MKKLILLLFMVGSALLCFSQSRVITGRITDETGNALPGVTVIQRGTTNSTTTNEEGNFSLQLGRGSDVLVISYVGRATQEINVANRTTADVVLRADDRSLQEVVVVGYGTQRRSEITGNVASIAGSKLRDQPIQSFEQGLSGRAAGVNISIPNGVLGNAPVIRVRGINSISLSSFPLVVIDGVPSFTGDVGSGSSANNLLGDINPADIESIEILKDASAAAIYGSRASAGVLLITTKKGRQGRTRVNYEGWAGWTKPYNLIEVLNAQEFTDLKNEGLTNAGTPPNNARGFYTMNDANGNLIDTRWYDYIYRSGFAHNHSISVSGANEKTNYYFSTGFTDQEGMFRNNDYKRMSGRFTLDHRVTNALTFGGTFNYTNTVSNGLNTGSTGAAFNTSGGARLAFVLAPNVSPYNADGSYNINRATNSIGQGANLSALSFTNPVMLLDLNKFTSTNDRILTNVYGQLNVLNGLTFKTLYGIDIVNVLNEDFQNPLHGDGTQFNGNAVNQNIRPRRWNWQNTLTYDTRLFENHGLNLLVGAEQQYTRTNTWGAARRNVSDPFFNEYQGGFTEVALPAGINSLTENFLQSYFGRINYDFKRKYFLSANLRRDGYSAFANKWGTFYGASVGYAVSEEEFWQNSGLANVASSFRLRGSYGIVGNFSGISNYAYQSLYGAGLYGSAATIFFNQAGNPDLTWEKSKKLDVGFIAGLFNERVNVEVTYYKNDITDLILNDPQAPSRGIPNIINGVVTNNIVPANVGSMVNKGFEFSIGGRVLANRDFSWSSNFNITTVNNRVTALANNNSDILVATGGLELPSIVRVGESIGSFYAVRTDGINPDNGRRVFVLKDGTRVQYDHSAATANRWTRVDNGAVSRAASQAADAVVIGPAIPKYFGGFDNTFRYQGFDLNILLYFSGGNYIYNGSKAGLHDNRHWNNAKDALDRWQKAGDNATWPRVVFGDNVSNGSSMVISNNVEKGDFIKARNLSIGYTLPASVIGRANLSSVRFYVAAFNVFTITKYSGFDPEIQSNNGASTASEQVVNAAPSVDRNAASQARTINVGLNIGF